MNKFKEDDMNPIPGIQNDY